MVNPLLSVIIPAYNAEAFLPDLLDRLLSSGFSDMELLLIDDGSGDSSLSICRDYEAKDRRVRVFTQINSGPSAARNLGIRESRGTYIAFFDADDVIDIPAFFRTVSFLEHSDADVWAADYFRIARNGCTLDAICQIEERAQPIFGRDYLDHFLSDREQVWNIWRFIFQRDYLLRNGLFYLEGFHCAEDLEFMVRVLCTAQRPAFFHNPYYFYRVHYGNTLTRRYTLKRVSDLAAMLARSEEQLAGRHDKWAGLLRDKLVREYVRNLSLLHEVPEDQYPAALAAYKKAAGLLKTANAPELKLVCAALRVLGLDKSSVLILQLKQIKRAVRRKKIEGYEKKCQ